MQPPQSAESRAVIFLFQLCPIFGDCEFFAELKKRKKALRNTLPLSDHPAITDITFSFSDLQSVPLVVDWEQDEQGAERGLQRGVPFAPRRAPYS